MRQVLLLIFSLTLDESTSHITHTHTLSMTRTGLLGFSFLWLFISINGLLAQPVTYDQRQEGQVNVQVDVKDLQIVAFVDSDFLADYNYDYPLYDDADFTIKPQTKPTTAKPSSTTNENILSNNSSVSSSESSSSTLLDLTTTKVTEEPIIKDTTVAIINSTLKISENTTKSDQVSSTESTIKIDDEKTTSTVASTVNAESTTRRALGTAEPRKRCPMGFQMRSGRCFKRRHSLISPRKALMKLAPALLGKTQLISRHSTTTDINLM